MFVNALSFMGIQIALFGVYAIAFSTSQGFAEEDWISRSIKKYFRLEWGLAIGSSILLFSVVLGTFTIHLLMEISKPQAQVSIRSPKLAALCIFLFLLGLQIVFSSFYLSLFDLSKTLDELLSSKSAESFAHLILGGAAVHRCDNCSVLNVASAAEVRLRRGDFGRWLPGRLRKQDLNHQQPRSHHDRAVGHVEGWPLVSST